MVSRPWTAQGWNPYSYVQNSPLSFTDPTGYIMEGGCIVNPSGGGVPAWLGGGFTPWAATLWTEGLSFHLPFSISFQWGRWVSFSAGLSLGVDDSDDDGGSFEDSVTFSDGWTVNVQVGPPDIVWTLSPTTVSPGNSESAPADGPLSWLLNTWKGWRFERLRRKYEEIRAPCVRAHGPEGCSESTVKDLAPGFEQAMVIVGGASAAGPATRAAGGIRGAFSLHVLRGYPHTLGDLLRNATSAGRNGVSPIARAIDKHAGRPGSVYPAAAGNQVAKNAAGRGLVRQILLDPKSTFNSRQTGRFGEVLDVVAPDGRGLRYGADGRFIGLLEPAL